MSDSTTIKMIGNRVENIINQDFIAGILTILVILYASHTQIKLPIFIINLFNNSIFRVIILSLIALIAGHAKPHVALVVSILFVLTLQYVSKNNFEESFGVASGNICLNDTNCNSNKCIKSPGAKEADTGKCQ